MSKDDEFGLLRHLDELMEDLHDNVPKALKDFDADGIHDARVATRRLKAAMGLLEPVLTDDHRKSFEKVMKKLRRRLGPLRDLDVMIDNLSKLQSRPAHAAATGWLRERLEQRREAERGNAKGRAGSADTLSKLGAWWHVREEIEEAREAADTLLGQSLHLQLDAFAERAAGVVRQLAGNAPPAERHDPHELRIAGKLLRYTLELAQSQGLNCCSACGWPTSRTCSSRSACTASSSVALKLATRLCGKSRTKPTVSLSITSVPRSIRQARVFVSSVANNLSSA